MIIGVGIAQFLCGVRGIGVPRFLGDIHFSILKVLSSFAALDSLLWAVP